MNQYNWIKSRDDKAPVKFLSHEGKFSLDAGSECSWMKHDQEFSESELRHRIEPWLTSLFQSEHLALLAGSGLTHAVHHLVTGAPAASMAPTAFSAFDKEIQTAATESAKRSGRAQGNVEDQIRVANELLKGLMILGEEEVKNLVSDLKSIMDDFSRSILKSEANIAHASEDKRTQAFNVLVNFLMSFASRSGTRDRLQIFTTNYDRLIEAGAEIAGLHLLDRFVGNLSPIFRSSRLDLDMHYNPPGIRGEPRYLEGVARFSKLHGSVDWIQTGTEIRRMGIPFGVESVKPFLVTPLFNGATALELMIYPNAAKDRETTDYPYVELFRDLAASLCRPNSTLVTYGYSFGDEHINRIIEDMLTIPSTHLVIISRDDPMGRILSMYDKMGRPSQITLLVGPALGDLQTLVDNYLPKSAIDRASIRMKDLLSSRLGSFHESGAAKPAEEMP